MLKLSPSMDIPNPLEQIDSRPSGRSFFAETPASQSFHVDYHERIGALDERASTAFLYGDREALQRTILESMCLEAEHESRLRNLKVVGQSGRLAVGAMEEGGAGY